jgi:hypothetical protein
MKEIEAARPLPSGRRGALEDVLESLPPDDRRDLLEALNNLSIPAAVISRVMTARGYTLPTSAITRHRRGEAAYVPE